MQYTIQVQYNIGDEVTLNDGVKTKIIGYDYVKGRGLRYIVPYGLERKYFYAFEFKNND